MKQIRTIEVAATFAGCILGAGYVSGQELWQFFGVFGIRGFWGLVLTMLLLEIAGLLVLRSAKESGISRLDELIIPWKIPWLRGFMGIAATFSMVCVFIIMTAGAGALVHQITGLPPIVGSVLLCLLVTAIAVFGIRGMVSTFSFLTPVLVFAALGITVSAIATYGINPAPKSGVSTNPLLRNWAFSAAIYVSYVLFGSFGVLTSLGALVSNKQTIYRGTLLGTAALLLLSSGIVLCLQGNSDCITAELPMLAIAQKLAAWVGVMYALLLFTGMLGASQGCAIAVLNYLGQVIPAAAKHRILPAASLSLLALTISQVGFGTLIGTVYPVCGYFGFAVFSCLIIRRIQLQKQNARKH